MFTLTLTFITIGMWTADITRVEIYGINHSFFHSLIHQVIRSFIYSLPLKSDMLRVRKNTPCTEKMSIQFSLHNFHKFRLSFVICCQVKSSQVVI